MWVWLGLLAQVRMHARGHELITTSLRLQAPVQASLMRFELPRCKHLPDGMRRRTRVPMGISHSSAAEAAPRAESTDGEVDITFYDAESTAGDVSSQPAANMDVQPQLETAAGGSSSEAAADQAAGHTAPHAAPQPAAPPPVCVT